MKLRWSLLFFLWSAAALFGAVATETNSIVASVDGAPITLGDVLAVTMNQERPLYAALTGKALEEEITSRRRKALDELIDRKLILADYQRAPFEIPSQYVESMLDDIAENSGVRSRRDFAIKARESGTSLEELTKTARERLIVQAMISRLYQIRVNVTPEELYRAYEARKKTLGTPEIWRLSMIRIAAGRPDHDAVLKRVSERLASGSPVEFARLATEYSSGANAATGGDLGDLPREDLRREFAEAIGKEPVAGRVYGPVVTPEGKYFLLLRGIVPATVPDFRSQEARLREILEAERRKEALEHYSKTLREQSIIHIYL